MSFTIKPLTIPYASLAADTQATKKAASVEVPTAKVENKITDAFEVPNKGLGNLPGGDSFGAPVGKGGIDLGATFDDALKGLGGNGPGRGTGGGGGGDGLGDELGRGKDLGLGKGLGPDLSDFGKDLGLGKDFGVGKRDGVNDLEFGHLIGIGGPGQDPRVNGSDEGDGDGSGGIAHKVPSGLKGGTTDGTPAWASFDVDVPQFRDRDPGHNPRAEGGDDCGPTSTVCGATKEADCGATSTVCGATKAPDCGATSTVCGATKAPDCGATSTVCGATKAPDCGSTSGVCGATKAPDCGTTSGTLPNVSKSMDPLEIQKQLKAQLSETLGKLAFRKI